MIEINAKTREAYDLMHQGTLALAKMERHGIGFDEAKAQTFYVQLSEQIATLEQKIKKSTFYKEWQRSAKTEINIYSDLQLADFLYNIKGYTPTSVTKTGKGATNAEALGHLGIKEVDWLLDIRKLKKARDTYLGSLMRENNSGRIHPHYNLNLVTTYRSSSSDPNFQNMPKRDKEIMKIVRSCLIPSPGFHLMEVDFSQLEVSIAAAYHKDPAMIDYLKHDRDMHKDMAKQIFFLKKFDKNNPYHSYLRKAAKNGFVFPQFYGDYYKPCALNLGQKWGKLQDEEWKRGQGVLVDENTHLSDHLIKNGISSIYDFIEHIKKIERHFWGRRFPVYQEWKETQWSNYQKRGYVDLYTGFRCYAPSKSGSSTLSRNDAINYPVQGSAFHCLLWSVIQLDKQLELHGMQTRMIGQIHDAIVIDVHPDEVNDVVSLAKNIMTKLLPEHWSWINVPLRVEFEMTPQDGSWAEMQGLRI